MTKKFIWLLSPLLIVGIINCGGSTSKEAKELLLRLLKVVGIPQSIVVNICQDGNDNGICESLELQTKVTINKGDELDEILEKVSLTEEGEFFLENYDSSKKILMEIQDNTNVSVNEGKFTFTYNPATQELSVLQMMIDEGYLVPSDVQAIRAIDSVDSFYGVLFRDFEANLNTLGEKELSSPRSVLANMKEMANELLANGVKDTLPQNLNNCNGDQTCIDGVLAPLSVELLITDDESEVIVTSETTENKQLLANKTFYNEGLDDEGNKEIYSNQFNSDSTSYRWEVIEGTNKGETGINSITLEGNTLTDHTEGKTYLLLGKYTDFLLYEENKKESKFYFDLNKLKSDLNALNSEKIDYASYFPSKSMTKPYINKSKLNNGEEETFQKEEKITVNNNTISFLTTYDNGIESHSETLTINENTLTTDDDNGTETLPRYYNIGDKLDTECTFREKLETVSHDEYTYSGDILRIDCTDNSHHYLKKGLGFIVHIYTDNEYFEYWNIYYINK